MDQNISRPVADPHFNRLTLLRYDPLYLFCRDVVCVDLLLQEAMATVVAGVVGTGAVVAAATGAVAGAATEGGTAEEVGVSETLTLFYEGLETRAFKDLKLQITIYFVRFHVQLHIVRMLNQFCALLHLASE